MQKITLLFSTSKGWASRLIRLVTWSRWSHVAVVINKNSVIDATFTHGGVRIRSLGEALENSADFMFVDFWVPSAEPIIAALRTQVGKPYDWTALPGLWLRRDWGEDDSWFCSELVAWAFERAGFPLFRNGSSQRITPDHLWKFNPEATRSWQK